MRRLVRTLTGKGVWVEFVKESLTFIGEESPMATLLLSVMGAFAEVERALILKRQREGIAARDTTLNRKYHALFVRLRDRRNDYRRFGTHPGVPFDNNPGRGAPRSRAF